MRSIHIISHQSASNNKSSGAILCKHRTKPKNSSGRFIILSIISLLLLFLFSILLSFPAFFNNTAHADSSVSFTVDNSDTVLELTLPSSVTLDLVPSSTNNYVSFGTKRLKIGVGTNNPAGYTLSMTADSSNLTRTSSITDGNSNIITPTISPLSTTGSPTGYNASDYESSTYNTYTMNTWGYKLSTATNYMPMTTDTIELASTSQASNATSTTGNNNGDVALDFAAKVDGSMPAGTYRTTISFTLVANVASSLNCDVDLTGCTFYFDETIEWYGNATFNVNYSTICDNEEYNEDDGTSLIFDSAAFEGPRRTFIFSWLRINTSNYNYFGGGIYQSNGVIYEGTDSDTMSDTRNFGPTYIKAITITGGTDATNPDLITWFYNNATLAE